MLLESAIYSNISRVRTNSPTRQPTSTPRRCALPSL